MRATVGIRTCRACRSQKDKTSLLRMTIRKDGVLEVDGAAIEPGRGWYLCPEEKCLSRLTTAKGRRKLFGRELLLGPNLQRILSNTPGGVHAREDESV